MRFHEAVSVRLRIGGVPFGVGAPLLTGMAEDPTVDFVRETPSRLIEQLRKGQLDAALVSSIEAFRMPGYRVAPGLCIACEGPARSVRAFLRPGSRIRTVALDSGSEAAAALLRVLLARVLHAENCKFTRIDPTVQPAQAAEDLVLLIGDAGLRADPGDRTVLDLGQLWYEWTQLPFVFALWLLRPGAAAADVLPILRRARELAQERGVPDGTDGAIYYTLGESELAGLMRFRREAGALNLLDPRILPTFLSPTDISDSSASHHDG